MIVMGERRFRAATMAGLATMPCVVMEGEISAGELLGSSSSRTSCGGPQPGRAGAGLPAVDGRQRLVVSQLARELAVDQGGVEPGAGGARAAPPGPRRGRAGRARPDRGLRRFQSLPIRGPGRNIDRPCADGMRRAEVDRGSPPGRVAVEQPRAAEGQGVESETTEDLGLDPYAARAIGDRRQPSGCRRCRACSRPWPMPRPGWGQAGGQGRGGLIGRGPARSKDDPAATPLLIVPGRPSVRRRARQAHRLGQARERGRRPGRGDFGRGPVSGDLGQRRVEVVGPLSLGSAGTTSPSPRRRRRRPRSPRSSRRRRPHRPAGGESGPPQVDHLDHRGAGDGGPRGEGVRARGHYTLGPAGHRQAIPCPGRRLGRTGRDGWPSGGRLHLRGWGCPASGKYRPGRGYPLSDMTGMGAADPGVSDAWGGHMTHFLICHVDDIRPSSPRVASTHPEPG